MKLLNDVDDAVNEMLDGYVAAYGDLVRRVPGRGIVLRHDPKEEGRVALVIGNGSGHEPIAVGWVGHGMLDANAVGPIFAAPPPDLIAEAIARADRGAGTLLLVSHHEGDRITSEMAAELARIDGHDVRTLLMYDDVASAPKGREEERRGGPGTAFVYKVVGARAEEGASLDELAELGSRVRDATRTLSVAGPAGTSPITGRPMYELPEGEVFLGMGVHGEPGVHRMRADRVDAIVNAVLDELLADGPFAPGDEVLAFLNGSGGTSLMELLVAYRAVDRRLSFEGIVAHRPLVGSYVTTQETKGFSVSLCRSDPELRRLWDAPTAVPYFHR